LLGGRTTSEVIAKIRIANSMVDAIEGASWIQECVPENLEIKKSTSKQINEILLDLKKQSKLTDISVGSSTSAIPCSAFTNEIELKENFLVTHPVNPPHIIKLVEVVPAPYTSKRVVEDALKFMNEIGQSPILVKKEIDAFILNRLQGALLNEAFKLVDDDAISPDDLDKTLKEALALRWCFMGPFETIDLNAPGGVTDYVERYGQNMFNLAKQQSEPKKWNSKVTETINNARRSKLPIEKLGERMKWRDEKLMDMAVLKKKWESN